MIKPALAVHGGAGTILRSDMTAELEAEYRNGLEAALASGWALLEKGGRSVDAVEAAVISLENFPLFNAGRGAVFNHEGKNEMDASIMDGGRLRSGAVAFVRNIKNPIILARQVMEQTPHALLAGEGAIEFAEKIGVELADNSYFFTEQRFKQLELAIKADVVMLDHATPNSTTASKPIGTVGAVACDNSGNLAAATSTGGMTNKKFGRIGDTPIIGAGNYAENGTCAVSCTGHGEFFMLGVTAYDVAARMKYQGVDLESAATAALVHLGDIGGEGGFIAIDSSGTIVQPFNSDGMYRGKVVDGKITTEIYR